jgi:CheY-like chemotaxis protein
MLKRIVSDVLDMEKIEAGKVELELMPLNLAEEIGGVVRLLSAQAAEKGLVLNFECLDRDAPPVMGDPTRIKQIAINLLSNAIKFTQVGGVTVRLRMTALIDRPVVSVVIDVEDTGIGFDVSNAAWLFNRFGQAEASTTRRFGGTGLGLAISRALARQMGGDVSATSVVGEGSCFTIQLTLPIAEAAVTGDTDISPRGWENGLRILVAEDNPAIQRVIALLLASVNAQAQFVENGRDALEARRQSEFDVILMDMHMPELDGLGATRAIRAMEDALELPAVPVVMLTGNSSDADKVASQAAGAIGFVTKPVDPQALFAALGSAMKQAA